MLRSSVLVENTTRRNVSALMTDSIDLDRYFERIGYRGPRTATLETLRELHALHPAAIPFENLSPFFSEEVPLDLAALERKLVLSQRGGYCFEHNLIFWNVLASLGFRVAGLAARVLWNRSPDEITARGHMLLRVELEGRTFLADVGFGGQTLTGPLLLEPELVQQTPHEPFRLLRGTDGDYRLQSEVRGAFRTLYRFDLCESYSVDYEVTNYYLATNPRSPFKAGVRAARVTPGRRHALSNLRLTVHDLAGNSDARLLESATELQSVLLSTFGIRAPERHDWDAAFERLRDAAPG